VLGRVDPLVTLGCPALGESLLTKRAPVRLGTTVDPRVSVRSPALAEPHRAKIAAERSVACVRDLVACAELARHEELGAEGALVLRRPGGMDPGMAGNALQIHKGLAARLAAVRPILAVRSSLVRNRSAAHGELHRADVAAERPGGGAGGHAGTLVTTGAGRGATGSAATVRL